MTTTTTPGRDHTAQQLFRLGLGGGRPGLGPRTVATGLVLAAIQVAIATAFREYVAAR